MPNLLKAVAAAAIVLSVPLAARADAPPVPTMSVTGSGAVTYQPDIARISLGVRAESPSAAAAANMVNARAASVIAALHKLGIADADMTTSDYSIQYQPPNDGYPQPVEGAPNATTSVAPRRPVQLGSYVASETIDVKSSLAKAGPVLDASVAAGANQTNGISFDTSERTALYREALARAVADARAQAEILAKAAGVSIAGIESISAGGAPGPIQPMVRMSALAAPAQVMGGTGEVDASVEVVFKIR